MEEKAKTQVLSIENLKQEYGEPDHQHRITVVQDLFGLLADGELSDEHGRACIAAIEQLSDKDKLYAARPVDGEIDYFYVHPRIPENIAHPITNDIDR